MNILRRLWQFLTSEKNKDSANLKSEQRLSENFLLVKNERDEYFITSKKLKLTIKIKKGGYVPKSGLLMAEQLILMKIYGRALDIGTGETGILANCLYALGANCVMASDIDIQTIEWARQCSKVSPQIFWINCDLFPPHLSEKTFDIIVSNPPQMPMEQPGHLHDYGGPNGRDYVLRIIRSAPLLLRDNGKLLISCFDFLGIESDTGQGAIIDLAMLQGIKTRIISKRVITIRKGGKTEANIKWIENIYPKYSFKKDTSGNLFHEIFILEMKLLDNSKS